MDAASEKLQDDGDGFEVTPLSSSPNIKFVDQAAMSPTEASELLTRPCESCGSEGENWLCLSCKSVFCSRYQNGHAVQHASSDEGCCSIHLSFADLSVWDHKQEAYLDVFQIHELHQTFAAVHLAKFGEVAKLPRLELL